MAFCFTACGGSADGSTSSQEGTAAAEAETTPDTELMEENEESPTESRDETTDILVAYFSATGNTKTVAENIAKITGEALDLDGYSVLYLGYPIWHGQAPRILSTFVESCDLEGVRVIPFCTSGSSGIGSSADSLAEQAGGGAWLEGRRFDSGVPDSELQAWIDGLA